MSPSATVALLTVADDADGLDGTLSSLLAQTDDRWQWCVAVTASAAAETVTRIRLLADRDGRVMVLRGATDDPTDLAVTALALATAGYVGWLDAGDSLDPQTIAVVASRLVDAAWLYTDEGLLDADDDVCDVWYKPDFAPEWLLSQPYAVRLAVLPRQVVQELGGVRAVAGTAAWYDLVLRVAERLGPADHVAGPYYLRRTPTHGPPYVLEAAADRCRVVGLAVGDDGPAVEVSPIAVGGRPLGQRVRRTLEGRPPRVSVIIPTRCSTSVTFGFPRTHAVELIRELCAQGGYPDLEIVVVYDTASPAAALAEIEDVAGDRAVLVPWAGEFHFSRKCNAGALAASGEYLCFLNDDMETLSPDWLAEMASLLADPGVGAVGARLVFADGTIQHAGHEYLGGFAHHRLFRRSADDTGRGGSAHITSERSGVTAACLLVRAGDFLLVGGFSDEFPLSYNDVDFSLKIRAIGLRILYTPHATLRHFESQTRHAILTEDEIQRIRRRWLYSLYMDPYVNELERVSIAGPTLDVS